MFGRTVVLFAYTHTKLNTDRNGNSKDLFKVFFLLSQHLLTEQHNCNVFKCSLVINGEFLKSLKRMPYQGYNVPPPPPPKKNFFC